MNDIVGWILGFVQSVDPALRVALAGVGVMLETSVLIGLIVPGDTIVIATATAVNEWWEGVILGAVVVAGALVGESVGFALGRWLGPAIQRTWLGRRIGAHNWERAERYLRRRGGPAIFISRFLPVLHSLVPLTVGMSGFSYRKFLAWTTPACAVWAGVYVTVSALAAGTYRELSGEAHFAGYIFVGIFVIFFVVVFLARKLLERSQRRHLADAVDDGEG